MDVLICKYNLLDWFNWYESIDDGFNKIEIYNDSMTDCVCIYYDEDMIICELFNTISGYNIKLFDMIINMVRTYVVSKELGYVGQN